MANEGYGNIASASIHKLQVVERSGEPPRGGDMETRVAQLENDFRDFRTDLKAIRLDLSEIKGKISNMPSTWQMIGICGAMLGMIMASGGTAFALARYLSPN